MLIQPFGGSYVQDSQYLKFSKVLVLVNQYLGSCLAMYARRILRVFLSILLEVRAVLYTSFPWAFVRTFYAAILLQTVLTRLSTGLVQME